ncbi:MULTISPECIES: DUF4340 domain-containing protein [unclassified Paenibacillus]|uniref:DUF4340 domain-containing protein n=1 Tax=Paenibacillus provencensis TaxID=441151 RepID=A0ABW3Q2L0_9BACL|nr:MULTISPECIES: DUF4340 domain-containing protein [unclassified Paenibacillus]MCM3129881.1 DUF4340 domain-containing protein [Paenibacillus sp. MER 78]SFS91225.1 protein of unknown function [Paenibacillus sp. 453mf]
MKKFIPTLLLLVILAGGWIYAHSQNYFKEEPETARKLMDTSTIDPGEIEKFSVITGGEEVQLTKEQDGWVMTKPEAYPVNSYAVGNWLEALRTAEITKVIVDNPTDVEKYGLDLAGDGIVMTAQNGTELTLAVGHMLPTGEDNYVQIDGSQVAAVSEAQVSSLMLSPLQFMDTTPFEWDNDQLESLEWEGEDSTWVLRRTPEEENSWTMNGKDVELAEADSLMNLTKNIATDQVLKPLDADQAQIAFTLTAALEDGTNRVYQGWMNSSEPGVIFVKTADDSLSYVLAADSIQEIKDKAEELLISDAEVNDADTE